jgi:HD-GYP domain-containing protein (c-di-GMP phosphodiesterase class II)
VNEVRAPKGGDWGAVMDVLHALGNMITVRSHYTERHPAIAQADDNATAGFTRVLEVIPDLVVALVDGEFIVCERPLPDLRARLHSLADAMVRHEIECIVFQRGMTRVECGVLGMALALPADVKGRVREQTQSHLMHVLLRFVVRAGDSAAGSGTNTAFFMPPVHDALVGVARSLASDSPVDKLGILAVANQILLSVVSRSAMISQRSWTRSMEDEATHASNVAIMTAALAVDAGYPQRMCIDATAAAIVHDIGHLFLPDDLRGVPEPRLDERSRPVFRNHTFAGAAMLLGAGCSPLWIAAAFEHHRGVDGGGYPTLETKEAPHELVRMIALANYFDSKRTIIQGRADEPEQALRSAMELEARYFGAGMTARFLRVLGVFPPGTVVELSNREPAVVTRANPADPWRPQVKLLRGAHAGRLVELRDVSATEVRHRLSIVRAIAPPLLVLADAVVAPFVVPVVSEIQQAEYQAARAVPQAEVAARDAQDRARAELGGMSAILDALLTVPTEAFVSAMPPAPSNFPRAPMPMPSIAPPPRFSSHPPPAPLVSRPPPAPAPMASRPPPAIVMTRPPPPMAPHPPPPAAAPTVPPPETEESLLSRIGAVTSVPVLVADVTKVNLDPRAAFVLRFLDGMSSIDDILDASGLPRVEALRILAALVEARVIALR